MFMAAGRACRRRASRCVVLVPFPKIAIERDFRVDLELMHVNFSPNSCRRVDHARMGAEHAERFAIGVGGKRGARRASSRARSAGGPAR